MCHAIEGLGELLGYWDESKLSFDSLIPLYDKGTSWDFLILFTFFSFGPKSGKRIYSWDKGHQGLACQAGFYRI